MSDEEKKMEFPSKRCPACGKFMVVKKSIREVRTSSPQGGEKVVPTGLVTFTCTECGSSFEEIIEEKVVEEAPKKKGCFIATAAYGTPFASEIQVLRRWRDHTLRNNLLGRCFVVFYYWVSPSIAKVIARHELLKRMTRKILRPIIRLVK